MIYKDIFNLTGTEQQQQIVKEGLDAIKFPFERLHPRFGTAEIGWANLNGQALQTGLPNNQQVQVEDVKAVVADAKPLTKDDITAYPEDVAKINPDVANEVIRHHDDDGDGVIDPDKHEPLMGRLEGREYVLGVFYPYNGAIFLDNALVDYPHYAQTTVSAEIAHSVDEFIPLTDEQRDEIMKLVNGGDDTGLTWWEKVDYSAEYYSLIGETFMILFTYAYSDLGFEGADEFVYHGDPSMGEAVRTILGIDRTDAQPALPTDEPTVGTVETPTPTEPTTGTIEPSEPAPVEPTTPEPTPDTEGGSQSNPDGSGDSGDGGTGDAPAQVYVRYGKSKIYHLPTHYKNKVNGVEVTDLEGLRICKICQKRLDKNQNVV
jgi:hypothetical protein